MFRCWNFAFIYTLIFLPPDPFKRTKYSLGAIYGTIQNLLRKMQFKEENVILIGLIPGPKETSLSIDSYLKPLSMN